MAFGRNLTQIKKKNIYHQLWLSQPLRQSAWFAAEISRFVVFRCELTICFIESNFADSILITRCYYFFVECIHKHVFNTFFIKQNGSTAFVYRNGITPLDTNTRLNLWVFIRTFPHNVTFNFTFLKYEGKNPKEPLPGKSRNK